MQTFFRELPHIEFHLKLNLVQSMSTEKYCNVSWILYSLQAVMRGRTTNLEKKKSHVVATNLGIFTDEGKENY